MWLIGLAVIFLTAALRDYLGAERRLSPARQAPAPCRASIGSLVLLLR
jgi:hypothetical protein